jgi:uncharacterized protein DUF3572
VSGTDEGALILALQALGFLAADDHRLSRFLGVTGIDPARLRRDAEDPLVLGGVLAYLAEHEVLLIACAEAIDATPEELAAAHRRLNPSRDADV